MKGRTCAKCSGKFDLKHFLTNLLCLTKLKSGFSRIRYKERFTEIYKMGIARNGDADVMK